MIHGTGKAEKPYENVHAFGEEEAFDMNKHAYKNGTGGNYMHITRASQSAEMLLSNKGNATQSSSKENLMSGKTPAFIIAGIVIAGAVIMTFVLTTGQKKRQERRCRRTGYGLKAKVICKQNTDKNNLQARYHDQ